ncbi:MAG: cold-shock protein [Flavobacteriales bacterium]|nr:MAG: cold-shock protein [Flavobacteriales bacterium]
MGRKNYNAFIKKQKEEKKRKKKEEKKRKKEARKILAANSETGDMIAEIDENGNIIIEPPEESKTDPPENDLKSEPS